ncbi:TadE family type IV pilus minor pilin [Bailinhaonella thermotolerans]|nr:TadE family type IV pilus minor pilin [Bailinhaonella thermotolerans]
MATALPALVVVVGAALWAIVALNAQLACVDAARAGARAAARGEPAATVEAQAARTAPQGARVTLTAGPEETKVEVTVALNPLWLRGMPPLRVGATAVSATEPQALIPP